MSYSKSLSFSLTLQWKCRYVYGILSNCENICEVTSSRAFQIDWSIEHLRTGNSFLSFIAPKYEHEFMVMKFEDGIDRNDDKEFSRQLRKSGDVWLIAEYTEGKREFCDTRRFDKVQYKNELDVFLLMWLWWGVINRTTRNVILCTVDLYGSSIDHWEVRIGVILMAELRNLFIRSFQWRLGKGNGVLLHPREQEIVMNKL